MNCGLHLEDIHRLQYGVGLGFCELHVSWSGVCSLSIPKSSRFTAVGFYPGSYTIIPLVLYIPETLVSCISMTFSHLASWRLSPLLSQAKSALFTQSFYTVSSISSPDQLKRSPLFDRYGSEAANLLSGISCSTGAGSPPVSWLGDGWSLLLFAFFAAMALLRAIASCTRCFSAFCLRISSACALSSRSALMLRFAK